MLCHIYYWTVVGVSEDRNAYIFRVHQSKKSGLLKILKIESAHSSETSVTCLLSRTTCILLALVFLPPFLLPLTLALYLLVTITCLPFVYRQKAPRHPDPSITPRRRKVCCLFCCLPHSVGPSGQQSSFSWDGVS
jgi:hypothetical protein